MVYTELSAITQALFIPKLVDNIFNSNAGLARAKKKYYEKGSGTKAHQPLAYAVTTAAGRFSGTDSLSITANQQIEGADFAWCEYYASIPITKIDEVSNSGKEAIISLVKAKTVLAEKSLASLLGTDLFAADSTTNGIRGFGNMSAVSGTYGGIDKAAQSWWQGSVNSTDATTTLAVLQTALGSVSIDNDKPTVAFTTQAIYNRIVALFTANQRFTDSKTADGGFQNILVAGVPIIVDSHVPANTLYFINENYCTLYYLEDFRFEPFVKSQTSAVSVAKVYWTGALAGSNCRMQAKCTALTA